AYLQVGAMLGTIMAANVLFVIIPAHRKLVAAMAEKREPDARPLLRAKDRSVHNNYLTLPVLFTMLAGHFAFTYGADAAWLVFVLIAVLTALIRVFFNRWHTGRRAWWIPAVAVVGVVALAIWLEPDTPTAPATRVTFAEIAPIVEERCATCHSGAAAPLGIKFETQEQIEAWAGAIEQQAVITRRMPPGNATGITEEERELLGSWIASR
ncbi:MAG: urate hydroxylase PuuD, partial [Gaiellaceae bacterium]